MSILITGITGFVGSHLVDYLLQNEKIHSKEKILGLTRWRSPKENILHLVDNDRVEFVYGDVRNRESIDQEVMKSDYVFHLAASNIGSSEIKPQTDL